MKTYSDLIKLSSFDERLNYLILRGKVGYETFGYDRYLNQYLYQRSAEWKKVRDHVILRDKACDLAHPDHEIFPAGHRSIILVHHMNPISKEDILSRSDIVLDPEFLITTTRETHNIIHYGLDTAKRPVLTERTPNDTSPWRRLQHG